MHVRANPAQSSHHRADVVDEVSERVISRSVGEELRRTREMRGWSRPQLVARLPSGIGDRTLLSYEHGTRQVTVLRLIEICRALGVDPAVVLARGLQRARIHMEGKVLHLDLRELHRDSNRSNRYRPMAQWAHNALNEHPNGTTTIEPSAVRNLALFLGCPYADLANYLARFTPDDIDADSGH